MAHLVQPDDALQHNFLPDPAIIARAYGDLQEELGKLRTLPALDQGRLFLEAINEQFTLLRTNMNERFDRLENQSADDKPIQHEAHANLRAPGMSTP
jgi:hypothetical protein